MRNTILANGFTIDIVVKLTGLTEGEIRNAI